MERDRDDQMVRRLTSNQQGLRFRRHALLPSELMQPQVARALVAPALCSGIARGAASSSLIEVQRCS
jgi:hypothetical protein